MVWKKVMLQGTPAGQATRPPKAGRWSGLKQRNERDPLTITVRYRGGAEGWWVVQARGRVGAFPSSMALIDVMAEINRSPEFYSRER